MHSVTSPVTSNLTKLCAKPIAGFKHPPLIFPAKEVVANKAKAIIKVEIDPSLANLALVSPKNWINRKNIFSYLFFYSS